MSMMGAGVIPNGDASFPVRESRGYVRSAARRLRDAAESFLAAGNLSLERTFLIVRPAIAALVIVAVLVAGDVPGRQGVIIGCTCAIVYNFLVAALVVKRRMYALRVTTILLDNLTIVSASLWVFMRMGEAGYESDLWLAYLLFIITSAASYGPLGSLLFASLWTGLLVLTSLAFYEPGSYTQEALPMRLVFFCLVSFCVISLAAELRYRREKLERQSRQTLSMLATIVEARDTDAGAHLRNITHYSRALALSLGLSERQANEIAYAAMIHDVGKAQVPDAILKKPGPLTLDERREIEKHTIWGYDLLSDNEEFSRACQVVRSHHERWDGTGYPDGLKGEDIPLSARITAVADVYDALTSRRPYKAAWGGPQAIDEIRRLRGSHFDPHIADAFIALYESGALAVLNGTSRNGHGHGEAASERPAA